MANTPVERKLEEVLDAIDTILEDCNEVLASKGKPPIRVIADLPAAVEGGIESSALIDTDKGLGIEVIEDQEYIYVKVDNSSIKFNADGQLYANISGLEIITANELPTASASTFGKLYLIPSTSSKTQNVKDEYITIQNGSSYDWEQIGSTEIDLTDYATKAWVEAKGYALDSDLAEVAKSGNYEDLINTPTIPEQEQADWNQTDTTAVDFIKNKPVIQDYSEVENRVITYLGDSSPIASDTINLNFALPTEPSINVAGKNAEISYLMSLDGQYAKPFLKVYNCLVLRNGNLYLGLAIENDSDSSYYPSSGTNAFTFKFFNGSGSKIAERSLFSNFNYAIINAHRKNIFFCTQQAVIGYSNTLNKYPIISEIQSGDKFVRWDNYSADVVSSGCSLAELKDIPFKQVLINGDRPKTEFEKLSDKVSALETSKQNTLTAGSNITIVNDVISASGGSGAQIQSDWNQTDNTQVDYIKNKPTIPSNEKLINLENRYNLIFGDDEPPTTPEYPPVKTNFVLPSNNLPMITGYNTSFSIFTVDSNGNPYYYEIYLDVPAGVIIHGIGFASIWSDTFELIVSNTNSSDVTVSVYFDKYNATTGNKEITKGNISSLGTSVINANASQLCLPFSEHQNFTLYNTEFYVNVYNIPLITSGTFIHTKQWTGSTTLQSINNNWQYTINAGSTDSTPWEQINDKVTALESRENIRTYYDSTTGILYLTNDGSDPQPE